jgi:hypothetical protein
MFVSNIITIYISTYNLYFFNIKARIVSATFFFRPTRWDPLVSLPLTSRRRVPPVRLSWAAGGEDWPQPRAWQIPNPGRGSVGINAAQICLANKGCIMSKSEVYTRKNRKISSEGQINSTQQPKAPVRF